jgi:hypothetical protein
MSDISVEDLVQHINEKYWNNPSVLNLIIERLGKMTSEERNDYPVIIAILEEIEIHMESAEHWLKDITIDTPISNITSLLYSSLCEKISKDEGDITQENLKNELSRLGIINIDNTDSKQLIEMEDPSDFFIKVISNIEDSFDGKITLENIIIRNEWHAQINLICGENENENDNYNKNEYTIHILYISKDLIPNPKNKNDSLIVIMEPIFIDKHEYTISNAYSIDESLSYDINKEQWKTFNPIKSEIIVDSILKNLTSLLNELCEYINNSDTKEEILESIFKSKNYSIVPIQDIHSSIINLLMPTPCSPSPYDKKKFP